MGRVVLVVRLAVRDLRRRPGEAALVLLALAAAAAMLTLGLVLRGVTQEPYERTRAATAGPDVVASVVPAAALVERGVPRRLVERESLPSVSALEALTRAPGVRAHSGPFPVLDGEIEAGGHAATIELQGRDVDPTAVEQPDVTDGSWVRDGGAVVERSFAEAFDVGPGDAIELNGRSFTVAGVAVTAAVPPYPATSWTKDGVEVHPGLVWVTRADARALAPAPDAVAHVVNLALDDPGRAEAFVDGQAGPGAPAGAKPPMMYPWQAIADANDDIVRNQRRVLMTGSWLLALLALAGIAVLVGGRMADQIRRVGLLKAVGGTPRTVASVLLAQYVVLALVAAALGLAAGRLAAPVLAEPSAGLIGGAGPLPFSIGTVATVVGAALGLAAVATFVPAVRAARISTVLALADAARPPRRRAWLIALSARLPVPLLLGLRVAARRPRRVVLGVISAAVTVSGIVAALAARAQLAAQQGPGTAGLADPRTDRLSQVLLLIVVLLVAQAAVNAIFVTWATVLDARHSSALARALGATPLQVGAGLSAAQVLPALAGAILGVPGGLALVAAISDDDVTFPSVWWILAAVLGTVLVLAVLAAVPARISARRSVAATLRSELA